jgi:hypothetical protein
MSNKGTVKRVNKVIHKKTTSHLSNSKKADRYFMQAGMEPYIQLGTGERCKVKHCSQPVYSKKSGLCSYHRMKEAEIEFENRLRARQRQRGQESTE